MTVLRLLKGLSLYTCLLLAACGTTPVAYSDMIKSYSCDDLAAELRYLEKERQNLDTLNAKYSVVQDIGSFVASLGTKAIPSDKSLYGKGDIAADIDENTKKQKQISEFKNAKC